MKNIELFKTMLEYCNELDVILKELNDIEIPFSQRNLSMTKAQQVLNSKSAEKWLQSKIKTLLTSLSKIAKYIDKEYLEHLEKEHTLVMTYLNYILEYDPNNSINNDCAVFKGFIPSFRRFLLSKIFKCEYLNKSVG